MSLATVAKAVPVEEPKDETEELGKKIKEFIKETHSEELVVTLCGFIGTEIHKVAGRLKYILESSFEYKTEIIELSQYIKQYSAIAAGLNKDITSRFDYLRNLIGEGNVLRNKYGLSVLAELAIQKIIFDRKNVKEQQGDERFKSIRRCYIIDSLKNQEELELFRLVYRDIHYSIGVFSSLDMRRKTLSGDNMKDEEIDGLIDRDSGEEIEHGQQVRETFTQSDFFLRLDSYSSDELDSRLERFLHLIFGSKVITPTIEETAMYQASSAAGNSACLSRQVGAALTDKAGDLLSIGWNDVPSFGGGLYQADFSDPLGKKDNRCFNIGKGCWNDKEKNLMAAELVNVLIDEGLITKDKRPEALEKIKNSKIKGLLEFSRAIHAEMHAIINGCQTAGERVKGGMLFVTTYPCHNCARHIIVSGITKVYYIEPYRKSLSIKLHNDAISEDEREKEKVLILMYDGVSPSKYLQLFRTFKMPRKDTKGSGEPIQYDLKKVRPKAMPSLEAIPILEFKVSELLKKKGLEIKNES